VAAGPNSLGNRLRALRTGRGHSLAEVAEATGLSASFLSLVETGRSDITISRLVRVVDFYGVRITDLLDEVPHADSMVVRRNEHRHLYSRAEGIDVHLLSPDTRGAMMPVLTTYEPTGNWAEFKGAPGSEAFVYVLNGRLELDVEGHDVVELRSGDSAYWHADRPHRIRNAGRAEVRTIAVVTPAAW
jgi:XRE family transcriptional regulator, regulator of sulfur utilization